MGEYQELIQLTPEGIRSREQPLVMSTLAALGCETAEPCRSLDLDLLEASQVKADPLPLLCLRCRISHALHGWLLATYKVHKALHGIEVEVMASYALDDDGELTIRTGPSETAPFTYAQIASMPAGLISPFSAEVLRSYDSALCGLPHWSRLKIQAHNELKAYFRQHGLLLISDWALLSNSSPTRVRQACAQHVRSRATIEALCALHGRYGLPYEAAKLSYKQATGKASGWQPDLAFLRALAPDQDPFTTSDQLKAIALAIRQLLTIRASKSLDEAAAAGFEAIDPSYLAASEQEQGPSGGELKALIDAALQRAMDQHMPQVLATAGKNAKLLRCLWAGWAEGLTNRPLADRCNTSCGTVSKKLRPSEHASAIATAAAMELKRHPAFASCGQSVEAAERLAGALRNHLLEPEREGDIAPLRRWVQHHLSQS
ncbi:hypothetical protein [Synechococcus sp. CBW1108]|uniref:hypothetical protein n=1 Tax=Synechococcus sp. CBW1108 TaxID=1353147 RepID=UPI0018CF0EF3|nr:hypothetical protein [Synechococcus sp. CBW1108]QPN70009.1 hypothetical protein H8F27_16535 [Synechococcus sp. CBW1108]